MSRPPLEFDALDDVDLTDHSLNASWDLAEFWRRSRAEEPVRWQPADAGGPGFWVLAAHRDVGAVYRDHPRFTSERGNVLDALRAGGDSASRRMLSLTDGGRHGEVRRILTRTFSRRGLDELGARVRRAARHLVERALLAERCDFARDVAKDIPLAAICDLLGVPHADRERIFSLTSSMVASETPDHTPATAWQNKNEVLFYFAEMADERREAPHPDIVSLLVDAAAEHGLTEDEIVFNCYSLILGGGETTRMAISGAVQAFMDHPGEWAAFKSGRADLDHVVDEILRWTSPSMHLARTALEDVEIGGRAVRAGDIVSLWNVSSNRDETVFSDPDLFRIGRSPNPHTALGMGSHFCLGSHLARLEIGAVLEALRDTVAAMEPAGPTARVYSNFLGGLCSVPVTLTPEPDWVPSDVARRPADDGLLSPVPV